MAIFLGWVVFIVLFALWWAPSLDLFQNVVILIASIVGACLVVGMIWMSFGMRYGWQGAREKWMERVGAAVEESVEKKIRERREKEDTESE